MYSYRGAPAFWGCLGPPGSAQGSRSEVRETWEPKQSINEKQKNPIIKKLARNCAKGINTEVTSEPEAQGVGLALQLPCSGCGDGVSVQHGALQQVQPERKGRFENQGKSFGAPQSGSVSTLPAVGASLA